MLRHKTSPDGASTLQAWLLLGPLGQLSYNVRHRGSGKTNTHPLASLVKENIGVI